MSTLRRFGFLAAGLVAVVVALQLRKGDVPREARPSPIRTDVRAAPAVPPPTRIEEPTPAADPWSLSAVIARGVPAEIPPGIPSGPFTAKGPGGEPDALKELFLTPSQRTVIDALVFERDGRLDEIRRAAAARPPEREEADRLCASATAAQETCLTSIRDTLLPEQRERFDALVKSGRWGGYLLLLPHAR